MELNAKIYVAGHMGLVGSAIVRRLVKDGYRNVVTRPFDKLDLRRQEHVEAFFTQEKPDYVFLAAAKVGGILANNTYKAEFMYDNLMIATNIIHASYIHGVKKLINLGSSCIYPKNASQPLKEEYLLSGPLEYTNEPYALAKIAAIKLCRYYNQQYGTHFISVMPTNLYGPGDNFNLETAHVLPALVRKFHLAKLLQTNNYEVIRRDVIAHPIGYGLDKQLNVDDDQAVKAALMVVGITKNNVALWGSGKPYREFLYVDDLSQALLLLMNHDDRDQLGECINIGSGVDMNIKVLAQLIQRVVGFDGDIVYDASKPDGTPQKLLDVSKINRLGWLATVPLSDGIRTLYDWYVQTTESKSAMTEERRADAITL